MPAVALHPSTSHDEEVRALLSPAGTSRADLLRAARRLGFTLDIDACLDRLQQARRVVVCLQTEPSTIYPIDRPLSTPRVPRVEDRPIHVRGGPVMAVSDADSDLDRWGRMDANIKDEIARLIREGRLVLGPDPDLERLAREYRVVPAQEARSWR